MSASMKVFIGILVLGVLSAIGYGIYQAASGKSTNTSSTDNSNLIKEKNNKNEQNSVKEDTIVKQNSENTSLLKI
jgi:predicted negative regulator of RcsB-dependent stress response